MMTMLLVGLWHGANLTFIFWGLLHGIYLSGQRIFHKPLRALRRALHFPRPVSRMLATVFVFGLVCISWIFFRAKNMESAFDIFKSIFSWGATAHLSFGGMKFLLLRISFIAFIVLMVDILSGKERIRSLYEKHVYTRVFLVGLAVLVILFTGNFASNTFIYFQF